MSVVIEPPRGWTNLGSREAWRYRELLYFLAWRDVKVRYAQAVIGLAWAVLQPLLMMLIFTVFLGHLVKVPSDGVPYAVFALAGLVPWTFFANAVSGATESLVTSANLVSKVYFPRLVMPVGVMLSWLPDFCVGMILMFGFMAIYGIAPSWTVLLVPVFAVGTVFAAASVGIWLAALNVSYRDVRYAVPFVIQLLFFATPVVYPSSIVPERWRPLIGINPMAGCIEGMRWALFHNGSPKWGVLVVSTVVTAVLLVGGLYNFRRVEHRFADVI